MDWLKRLLGMARGVGKAELRRDLAPAPPPTPVVYKRYPFTEPGLRIAAIGDLHGRLDLLRQVGAQLDALARDPTKQLIEVYLGDYVDRAGDAKGVVEFLAERSRLSDRRVVCLAGNHEQLLLAALRSDRDFLAWLTMGGNSTLLSYGVTPQGAKVSPSGCRAEFAAALPAKHLEFLQSLLPCYACGGFFFVHAGVSPDRPLEEQRIRDLLWIRETFMTSNANFGATVVHGHTPVSKPQFRMNRIGIDTGAYFSGQLTCLLITTEGVSVLGRSDRRP